MPNPFAIRDASENPAPKQVYNWRIYALALSASMGSACFGYDSAFIGGTLSLPSFDSRFGLAGKDASALADLQSNIVSTFQAGCFFGVIACYIVTERFGRRIVLMLCGALFCAGAILQVAASGQLGLIYAGRVLTGLSVGASSMTTPIYISECSPPAIRGRMVGIFEIVLQLFLVIGFWVNYGVNIHIPENSDSQWRVPFGLQMLPGSLLTIAMIFQPESPRWLLKVGREDQATRNLEKIRNLPADDQYIVWEIDMIRQQLEHEASLTSNKTFVGKVKEAFLPGNRNRILIGMALMMLQNLSGINALNYYSTTIFKSIGFTGTSVGLLATGVFGIVKCAATIIFMFAGIDRLGRRRSIMIGSVGAMVAMFYLGGYTKISGSFEGGAKKDGGAYVAIVMIYIFAVFYAMSWNGIPWIFCAEVFPTAIRGVCLVFTTCVQWLGQFIITYSTPHMIVGIQYGTFLFFGCWVAIGLAFVWLFVPETSGLMIEDMDIMFGEVKGLAYNCRRKTDEIIAMRGTDAAGAEKISSSHFEKV